MTKINKGKVDCCGCTACENVCPHGAILMEPDVLGFLYPKVNDDKCVDCGLCEKVCSFHENYDRTLNLPIPLAYAARHKDMHEVETSQSGAAFIALSDWILEQRGIVYGAGYDEHFRVIHKRASNKEERNEFKGSKYVQSDLNQVFRQIKNDLKNGLIVFFSGTPI
jgi:ferredoxin